MAGPLSEPRDKADRTKGPVPPGGCQMRRLLCRAPWHRSVDYDLRRASRMHPHLALQRNRVGLVQRFPNSQRTRADAPRRVTSARSRYFVVKRVVPSQSAGGGVAMNPSQRAR